MSMNKGKQEKVRQNDILKAGTGFMISLTDTIAKYEAKGYTANLTPKYDHFEAKSGEIKLYPQNIQIDHMVRFENTSDPDDQSILYAVSDITADTKGLYVESYGAGQDALSKEMIDCLKEHDQT